MYLDRKILTHMRNVIELVPLQYGIENVKQ